MLDIPPIGMGTGFSEDELKDPDRIVEAIQVGIDAGMRFIDTAENYGGGVCEELVGRAIAGKRRNVVLASKFSPEHSKYDQVIAACERSLRRLKTDYLDLYQTHWPNPGVPFEETLRALHYLKEQGKIRAIGMSNVGIKELPRDVVSLQQEFNLFERTVEYDGTLDYGQKNNVSIIAYSPLDQGRTDRTLPSQLQLAWLVSHDGVIAIPKSANPKHVKENAEAMRIVLKAEDKARIDREFFQEIVYISTGDISVSPAGERNRAVYRTLKEATENRFGYVPSPIELAQTLKAGGFVKPVRLIPSGKNYQLINGRIRYWAWVIAFGTTKPIPAYIRSDLN
ncbi:MAG: aldo/keto reductase [Patescibacteria group bacterium]